MNLFSLGITSNVHDVFSTLIPKKLGGDTALLG